MSAGALITHAGYFYMISELSTRGLLEIVSIIEVDAEMMDWRVHLYLFRFPRTLET